MKKVLLGLTLGMLVFSACHNEKERDGDQDRDRDMDAKEVVKTPPNQHDLMARIDSLEGVLYADSLVPTQQLTASLLQSYLEYSQAFPSDSKTPEYLFKAGGIARDVKLPGKALNIYNQILDNYPKFDKRGETAFLIAFVYDADMNDKEKARTAYNTVISDYPKSPWAKQASERLKTLDLTDEQLIQRFEKMNKNKKKSGQSS